MSDRKQILQWLTLLLAILLPFLLIRSFPGFYHSSDVDDFFRWSQAWRMDWRSIYINCERCNYPFLGTLLSGGAMSVINIETFARIANRFRYYLAVVDALNVLMIWLLLKKLQVKNAPLWAGIIGLLPSSWLGSSVWGQIDGIGQFFLLLFFLLLIWFDLSQRNLRWSLLFSVLAGLLLSVMLLTKQLIYFSIFALGGVFLANIFLNSRRYAFSSLALALTAFVLPILIVDLTLHLKPPYFSHLQYILATGSGHGEVITYTGFNLWTFFTSDPLGPSSQALAGLPVTPYAGGILLFLLINTILLFLFVQRVFADRDQFVVISLVYLALVNLSFNLTLTGTHERYLYHFYPFILIACLAVPNSAGISSRIRLMILLCGSLIYGAFLYGYLTLLIRPNSLIVLRSMSALHILLFVYLIFFVIRQFKSQP